MNLRANCETELLAAYPAPDVCRQLGPPPTIAAKFYPQPKANVTDQAAGEPTVPAAAPAAAIGADISNHQLHRGINQALKDSAPESPQTLALVGLDGSKVLMMRMA